MKNYVDEVVVCDDGSTDKTSIEAKNAGATVIQHDQNKGKGAALRSLFDYAKKTSADVIITIDGDGQSLPQESEKLMAPIVEHGYDVVVGNRFHDSKNIPRYRLFGNKVLDKFTSLASDLAVSDTQGGFRAYSRKAIEKINFESNGFAADSEIIVNASKHNLKMTQEDVTVIYDTGGRTSSKGPVSHGGEVIGSLIELIALKHPLIFLGIPGLVLLAIGSIFSFLVILVFNDTRIFITSYSLVAIGSLVLGLLLILMAVVLFSIQRATRRS